MTMKMIRLGLCAVLLVACSDDDDTPRDTGLLDGGDLQIDAGGDAGPKSDGGVDAGQPGELCQDDLKVCASGVDARIERLCFRRTTEVSSGGLVVRCFVSPASQLYLSFSANDLAITTPGWTYDGYPVLTKSTLSSADETRCEQAKTEAAKADISVDGGVAGPCARIASTYPR